MALNITFNMLSTIFSLFSFAAIIPILRILFNVSSAGPADVAAGSQWSDASGWADRLSALKTEWLTWLTDQINAGQSGKVLFLLGLFLVVMTGIKCLCTYLASFFMIPIRTGVLRDLRRQLYDKVISLPIGYFTEAKKGDVMSRMTADVTEVEASIMASLDMLFKDPIMILIYLIMLFCLSWQLTLFVLILLPTAGWLIGRIGRSLKRRSTKGQELTAELLVQIEETLSGLRVVKAFNAEDKLRRRFANLNERTRYTFNRIHWKYMLAHPVSEFLGTILIAVLLWYGGGLILSEHSSIDAAVFIYYLVIFYSIINPAKDLTKAAYAVRKGMASLDRIDTILNTQNSIQDPSDWTDKPDSLDGSASSAPFITFDRVSFSYQPDQPVLCNIDLQIQRGQTVAFVGQSGSGKTTLLDLIPRFYDVTEGAILIGGTDVRQWRVRDLRNLMGIVSQDPVLFNDTVYNNIAFGVDDAGPEKVREAARIANALDFIEAMPDGFETIVGDRGSRLSGGQRQRISIARAVLKDPKILILDEATSALDSESEQLVQEALERLMSNRTTLVVAHRLSTIRNADLICVIRDGQIVETGRHEELLNQNGYYAHLINLQQS